MENEEEWEVNMTWEYKDVRADIRETTGDGYRGCKTQFHLPEKEFASPTQYFRRFLPENLIKDVVIPPINTHASNMLPRFQPVDYPEYLTWISLFIIMTIVRIDCHSVCWQDSKCPVRLNINFNNYMKMKRFKEITNMHVFVVPDNSR
jgi:hypothetical protein